MESVSKKIRKIRREKNITLKELLTEIIDDDNNHNDA